MSHNVSHLFDPGPVIVLVCPEPSEHDSLNGILQRSKCRLHCLRTCRKTVSSLSEHPAGVVISNADLPGSILCQICLRLFTLSDNLMGWQHGPSGCPRYASM